MTKSIDFCIPFIADGIKYLEHLVNNIERTAAHPSRVNIIVSYHQEHDLKALQESPIYIKISRTVLARSFLPKILFYGSANHSSAINALAQASTADIVIFSDYDMAFVYPGWDELLEHYFFIQHLQLCGVTYANLQLFLQHPKLERVIPSINNTPLAKYQNLPNLSFFCIRGDILKGTFSSKLTSFDDYLTSGGLPFRIINTPLLAEENNLPLGTIQWLDTGCELPEIIRTKNIPYTVFNYVPLDQQDIIKDNSDYAHLPIILHPEVFYIPTENKPFLCHFKKGTTKKPSDHGGNIFNRFAASIDTYLKNTYNR